MLCLSSFELYSRWVPLSHLTAVVYTEGLECLRRWRRSLAVYKLCCLQ